MPSWLPVALTIADFVVQRVDRVGPVSFEPPEKQPPERARSVAPSPAEAESTAGASTSTASKRDSTPEAGPSAMGFQARAGGENDPSKGDSGGGSEPDEEDGENDLRCSFRSMRVKDRPTTYEV